MTNSGARRKYPMIASRLLRTAPWESPGAGMLGWMVIHVHANIVERQLQSIPYTDRLSNLSSSRMKMDCKWFLGRISGGRESVGRPRVFQDPEKKQRYSKVRKIIVWTKKVPKSSYEIANLEYNMFYFLRRPHSKGLGNNSYGKGSCQCYYVTMISPVWWRVRPS